MALTALKTHKIASHLLVGNNATRQCVSCICKNAPICTSSSFAGHVNHSMNSPSISLISDSQQGDRHHHILHSRNHHRDLPLNSDRGRSQICATSSPHNLFGTKENAISQCSTREAIRINTSFKKCCSHSAASADQKLKHGALIKRFQTFYPRSSFTNIFHRGVAKTNQTRAPHRSFHTNYAAQTHNSYSMSPANVRVFSHSKFTQPLWSHVRNISKSLQYTQKPLFEEPYMPQVGSPDNDIFGEPVTESTQQFKGLETDFPCLSRVKDKGPEPAYHKVTTGYKVLTYDKPFRLQYNNGVLPELNIAYETFGELNSDRSNAVVVLAGLSASSHVRSSVENMRPGWWERFVGPGCALDTNKFFVISPNNLGSCYGSSGPSSINKLTGKPYGTTFPIISIEDMTNALFVLLNHLGIDKLYGAVGSSMGGMLSLQSAASYSDRVGRIVSVSACAQSHPSSIAMRYLQRKCIMVDPNWNKGHYYDGAYPKIGMKLAREIATITYRSGPEWEQRFGRDRINDQEPVSLCPTFRIESYLEHQGESFSTIYDPNSLLYLSKAMDMFDMSRGHISLEEGLARVKCPVMVIGVQTDILFPIWQQRTLAQALMDGGNDQVTFYELNSIFGHDTFLLDLNGVGAAVKGFLETEQKHTGILSKSKKAKKVANGAQHQACPLE